jgi:hypothetical protein
MAKPRKGLNTNLLLTQLFLKDKKNDTDPDMPNTDAINALVGRAKNLTLGQTWRLNGWAQDGDLPIADDPVLRDLSLAEMRSVSEALQIHTAELGIMNGTWKYVNKTYACGACCACCAVSLQSHYRE